jgi:hypothetical protein
MAPSESESCQQPVRRVQTISQSVVTVVNQIETTQNCAPLHQDVCAKSFQPEVFAFGQPVARFNDAFKPAIWHGSGWSSGSTMMRSLFLQCSARRPRRLPEAVIEQCRRRLKKYDHA